ncbi:hypothetical protein CEW83_14155 [Parazoarcus communis]|uniref:TniQ domain-containing protein n=1 Tax=Parazoarcus communis TaxID=41977 RepID=A0A2U8GT60_9RHOO|nr:TniQ family protein [Parazoarcus communis]AWI76216.1 hypothetical protein CEW83_14155 [Parazoarcus communis]
MTALLDLFTHEHDESAIGYMRRLALKNGYSSWKALLRACGVKPSVRAVLAEREILATALGLDPAWLEAFVPADDKPVCVSDPQFARTTSDPVCPSCLQSGAYVRRVWGHALITACPEHGTTLLDHCPNCGVELQQSRHDIAFCGCGFDLREAHTQPASLGHLWISARLAGDMRDIIGTTELGSEADYLRLADLLYMLAVRFDSAQQTRRGKVAVPKTINEAIALLTPVATMLESWPGRFEQHVRDRLQAGNPNVFNLTGRLGAWYINLSRQCLNPSAFAPVWQAFSNAVIDQFEGNLRGKNGLTPSLDRKQRYFALTEAARLIGTTREHLRVAIQRGNVSSHTTRKGPSYTLALIERAEVERIVRERAEWTSVSEAAETFAVPPATINYLVKAKLVEADQDWKGCYLKGGPIRTQSIVEFAAQLNTRVRPSNDDSVLTLSQLNGRRTTDAGAILRLYQAIGDGTLCPVREDTTGQLSGFGFSESEVMPILGSVALSDGLTLTKLESITGWKYEALSFWTNNGYLSATETLIHGRATRVVSNAALADFRRTWIPISDLARSLGTKASAMSQKAVSMGITIHGQCLLASGTKRGGLIAMADLARLIS